MMADWKELTVGDLCDTISDTYHRNDDEVVLVNTSDVLEGKILNHQAVENKNLKGQFKKTFKKDDIERAQSMSKSTTSQIAHLATSLTAEELKAVKEFLAFTKTALYKKIANENPSNANKNYKLAEIKAVETTEGIVAECQKQK